MTYVRPAVPQSALGPLSAVMTTVERPTRVLVTGATGFIGRQLVAALALADSTLLEGGVPIKLDGKVIGAVGVSGDTPQVDEGVAIAGANAFR
jgi:uncharacterized protein GlcG (DUF336 family)